MHAHGRTHVLAQQIHAVHERLDAVGGASCIPRIDRGMSGMPAELHDEVDDGLAAFTSAVISSSGCQASITSTSLNAPARAM